MFGPQTDLVPDSRFSCTIREELQVYTLMAKEKAATINDANREGVLRATGFMPAEIKGWRNDERSARENRKKKKVSQTSGFKRCVPRPGHLSLALSGYD